MTKPSLSIVLPTYNEKDNIIILIPEIEKTFGHVNHEIIVVDDSFVGGTVQYIKKI